MRHGRETTGEHMNFACCCCCSATIFLARGVPVASLQRRGKGGGGGEFELMDTCEEVVDTFCSVCWDAAVDLARK